MAALTANDVTVTILDRDATRRGRRINLVQLGFGDGAKTYPSTGVPLPAKEKLGMVQKILRLIITEKPVNGYDYLYDKTNHSIRIQQSASHTHDLLVKGSITADEALGVLSTGPTLGKSAATDRTIAGANSATKGGVVSVAAAPLAEVSTSHAPASTTLVVEVRGL
jgi:hypothetical protein